MGIKQKRIGMEVTLYQTENSYCVYPCIMETNATCFARRVICENVLFLFFLPGRRHDFIFFARESHSLEFPLRQNEVLLSFLVTSDTHTQNWKQQQFPMHLHFKIAANWTQTSKTRTFFFASLSIRLRYYNHHRSHAFVTLDGISVSSHYMLEWSLARSIHVVWMCVCLHGVRCRSSFIYICHLKENLMFNSGSTSGWRVAKRKKMY